MKLARKHALVAFASVACQMVSGASLTAGTNATLHQEPRSQHLRTPGHHHHHHHGLAHEAQVQPHEQSQIEPRELQKQVEKMAQRADRLDSSDPQEAAKVDGDLEAVEASLVPRAAKDPALEHEIAAVRADLCAKHGFESRQRMDCEDFMRRACVHKHHATGGGHGSAVSLLQRFPIDEADADFIADGDEVEMAPEVPVAMCKRFFREVAASESRSIVGEEPAPAVQGEAAPAGLESEAEAAVEAAAGGAPSAAPPMSPAPAPSMAPAPAPAENRPWYEADPEKGLPEQGVEGELVDHDDQDSQTEDWQREFGPKAGHRSYREICRDHPTNEWCKLHLGYNGRSAPAGWMREGSQKSSPGQNAATRRGGDALMALTLGAFAFAALER